MRTIQDKWESYRAAVLDAHGLSAESLEWLRVAFYAGAGCTLAIVLRLPEEGLSDAAAGAVLNGLTTELRSHQQELATRSLIRQVEVEVEKRGGQV